MGSALRVIASLTTGTALMLAFAALLGRFSTSVNVSILDFELQSVAPMKASTIAGLQAGINGEVTKLQTGLDGIQTVLTAYLDQVPDATVSGFTADVLQDALGAQQVQQERIDGAIQILPAFKGIYAGATTTSAIVNGQFEKRLGGRSFDDKYDDLVVQSRVAVGMALIAIVSFVLSLSMLVNNAESYVVVFLQLLGAVGGLIFVIMMQLGSNTAAELGEMGEVLGKPAREAGEAGPAVFCAGFSMGAGILASIFSGLAVRFTPVSSSSKELEMELEDYE